MRRPMAVAIVCIWAAALATRARCETAAEILAATGIHGGLVVHVGCGDGKLTAAFRPSDRYLVHGLDADAGNVELARQHLQSLHTYGEVSVEHFDGKHLPYVDNLVNLVVSEHLGEVAPAEVLRVLAPLGVAYVKQGGQWTKTVKPWPKEIDEWQQHFHDADNNAVAHDSVVGPPRHFQWIAEPEWTRSHLTLPSINSLVSSQGRLFSIEDQASAEHPALPGKFALVARDAFNGVVLWQRPFPDWQSVNIYIKLTPVQLQRRLVAVGDTVYCTPGINAPLTALDAATGDVRRQYASTEHTQEFAFDRGVLYLVIGDPTDGAGNEVGRSVLGSSEFPARAYGPEIPTRAHPTSTIVALQADSGQRLWQKAGDDTRAYQGTSLAIRGEYAVYCTAADLVCLDRTSGRQVWRVPAPTSFAANVPPGLAVSLVLSESAVYLADGKSLRVFALKNGARLWTGTAQPNHHKPADLFLAAGVVWSGSRTGYDPQTGQVRKSLAQEMTGPMGHTRCYRNRITDRFYINTETGGSDFLGLDVTGEFPNPWVRSTCGIGVLPCNGLLYVGPPACSCCNWVMLNALNALAPEPGLKSSAQPIEVELHAVLQQGAAYGSPLESTSAGAGSWPTYRHDPGRSGDAKTKVPAALKPCWQTKLATHASPPVIAAGKVFVAEVDRHAVCALDAADGHALWRYTAGARVDSPPTYYQGLLLFGSHDGWVYCLRASDGALVWRFRELPDRLICAYGQLESAWPVCGSVLVKDDVAYFAAGRNSFLDGGIFLYALDPRTGRIVHQRRMYGPYNAEGYPIITTQIAGKGLDGFKGDIFLTDGEFLYLRQQAFLPDLSPLTPEQATRPHLIPSPGFIEAIPHHRTYWTIDSTIRYDIQVPKGSNPHGDILVMDGKEFYEVRGYSPGRVYSFDPRVRGYTLFAGTYAPPTVSQKDGKTDAKKDGKKRKKKNPQPKVTAGSSERWSADIPLTGKAMAMADGVVFVAGTPVAFPADDLAKAYEGRMGGVLWAASAATGAKLAEYKLDAPPVWDGMAAADGRLYVSLKDGCVMCWAGK